MTRRDWLLTGFRLLGVYFGVLGLQSLLNVAVRFSFTLGQQSDPSARRHGLLELLFPILDLIVAYALIRETDLLVVWCREPKELDEHYEPQSDPE